MTHIVPPMIRDHHPPPQLVEKIVEQLKKNGLFDQMRRECLADIDTKPAFQNLKQRVESHVTGILSKREWKPSLNKNQLRSEIRDSVLRSGVLTDGVEHLLHQVVDANANVVILPKIAEFIQQHGDEMKKEFLPVMDKMPLVDMPPMMMNPPNQFLPGVPIPHSDMHHPMHQPPVMAPMPPLPISPMVPLPAEHGVHAQFPPPPKSPLPASPMQAMKGTVPRGFPMEEASSDKPQHRDNIARTPSPKGSSPGSQPVIPRDAVNPLRNLIQSLLTSKQSILSDESGDDQNSEENLRRKEKRRTQRADTEGYSPTIDPAQIEAFTDDEVESPPPRRGPRTPNNMRYGTPTQDENRSSVPSPDSASPPSPYSPISEPKDFIENERVDHRRRESDRRDRPRDVPGCSRDFDRRGPDYHHNFKYERPPSPRMYLRGSPPRSPRSFGPPIDARAHHHHHHHYDRPLYHPEDRWSHNRHPQPYKEPHQRPPKRKPSVSSSSVTSSSDSDSDSSSSSTSSSKNIVEEAEVEETVEEIEVVEEYSSLSEGEQRSNKDEKSENDAEVAKEPKVVKKSKKHKEKKRKMSKGSISSGEITSSGELTSDSSSSSKSRPTRPNVTQRRKTPTELMEMEERRRAMQREEEMRGRRMWTNTESSSDYMSSPARVRVYSPPPRRRFSPEFHRFENERIMEPGYRPPPFRERPRFREDFRPPMHHPRFSPPPFRRSPPPPHRYSPGPRMDYPPFGSPRSPPRRNYSPPPHHGPPRPMFPEMRPPFPHHMHRYGSPPHPGMRRSSRSPPHPGMRRPSRSPPPHPPMRM